MCIPVQHYSDTTYMLVSSEAHEILVVTSTLDISTVVVVVVVVVVASSYRPLLEGRRT